MNIIQRGIRSQNSVLSQLSTGFQERICCLEVVIVGSFWNLEKKKMNQVYLIFLLLQWYHRFNMSQLTTELIIGEQQRKQEFINIIPLQKMTKKITLLASSLIIIFSSVLLQAQQRGQLLMQLAKALMQFAKALMQLAKALM